MSRHTSTREASPNGADSEGGAPGQRVEDSTRLLALLDERVRFETLLARLSATFINLPAAQVDEEIAGSLAKIVTFLGVERSTFGRFAPDGSELFVTHSYAQPGFEPVQRMKVADLFPWATARWRRGQTVCVRSLSELPPEAARDRDSASRLGLKSNITIPVSVAGVVEFVLAVGALRAERDWSEGVVQGLHLVGEVFANALARKRAEERETRLRDQLARVARVTLLGELAASIAHEVNQPLCAIVSNAETAQRMLGRGVHDVAEVREALEDITQDGQRASAVLARIRASLQQGPVERAPVDLNDLVREVAVLVRNRMAGRGLAVKLDLAERLPAVLGDRVQLQQVLLNLLVNGADAMAGVAGAARELVLRSRADGAGRVAVEVQDAGTGLDPAHGERIFEALFTTKPDGLGMGLAICKSILAAHDGEIVARPNSSGRGTTFQFTLPALRDHPP